ncbi:MAG: LPS export ABC transporter ATP-binding protein [Candidatus Krumholzibacteriota bacterium]|nr:LPS export ABC transporter ATP-binding protein [Candidatus Krumholzibacteriota bacterium]
MNNGASGNEHDYPGLGCRGLVKAYGKRCVVNDVSINVKRGEIVGLLGPNGAGKTTTFYMITGMIRPDKGQVILDRDEITSLPMYKRARKGIGYLPQEASIFRKLTVEDNLKAILETLPLSKKEQDERLESLLTDLNVEYLRKSYGYQLSGGERRRVEVTRSLVTEPSFMLLDEPFAGIDPIAVADLQSIVTKLREKGLGVLITDHNVRETLSITDRAYIMYEGSIKRSGTADDLAGDPEVREIYLGDAFRL